jgi:hypothetical protein
VLHTSYFIIQIIYNSSNLTALGRSQNFRREFNAICANAIELPSCEAVIVYSGGKVRIILVGLHLIFPFRNFLQLF